jgi:flagellar biosynthetic protein FlhB
VAGDTSQERREPATQKRREDARKRGQTFRSTELTATCALLGGVGALVWGGGQAAIALRGYFVKSLAAPLPPGDLTVEACGQLLRAAMVSVARVCLPVVAGAAALGLAGDLGQGGVVFTGVPLAPNLERINPLAGLKRLASRRAVAELFKSVAKVVIVAAAAILSVSPRLGSLAGLSMLPPEKAIAFTADLAVQVVIRTLGALLVVAFADYAYQRWEHERDLRMTRDELKQELKETEGDPQLRARIRQRQREIARRRMMAAVPKADLVVTNPTHYACALSYEGAKMRAPRLVAKGQNYLALKIREIAREHRVPMVENPPLARALYVAVEVGDEIPPDLYRAVAEVLAFVYRLRGKVA